MKALALTLAILGFLAVTTEVQAMRCHAGVYRSGCVSRYGTTVRRHGYRGYANRCYWRAGGRVCY
jgi:hypothetical protein